jgi:uncharacterized damage-inducible protein DinB
VALDGACIVTGKIRELYAYNRWANHRRLSDDSLRSTVRYRTTEGDTYEAPLWQLMRHVVNHSTYHRGQVATMLRQLGATAPATDLVVFHRERPS